MKLLEAVTFAVALIAIAAGPLSVRPAAARQIPDPRPSPSVERIRNGLTRTPARSLKFDAKLPPPVATFKSSVNQRVYLLPFLEQLRKDFELSPLQRQSAQWSSKCCGLNLSTLTDGLERALRERQARKIREQVTRELAAVKAAAKK
jgi:hypothetical protein